MLVKMENNLLATRVMFAENFIYERNEKGNAVIHHSSVDIIYGVDFFFMEAISLMKELYIKKMGNFPNAVKICSSAGLLLQSAYVIYN